MLKKLFNLILCVFLLCSCSTSHKLSRNEVVSVSTSEQTSASKVQTSSSLDSSFCAMLLHIDSIVFEYESPVDPSSILQHKLAFDESDSTVDTLTSGCKDSTQTGGTRRARDLLQGSGVYQRYNLKLYGIHLNSESSNVDRSYSSIYDSITSVSHTDSVAKVKENSKSTSSTFSFFHVLGVLVTMVMLLALVAYIVYRVYLYRR